MRDEVLVFKARRRYTLEQLVEYAAGQLAAAGVVRAIVFGSWARGTADGYSDLDLAVVLPTKLAPLERGSLLAGLIDALPIGVDLLVYTPEEFARGMATRYGIFDALAREGVTIYPRPKD